VQCQSKRRDFIDFEESLGVAVRFVSGSASVRFGCCLSAPSVCGEAALVGGSAGGCVGMSQPGSVAWVLSNWNKTQTRELPFMRVDVGISSVLGK
jgi:hypothetical protein